MKLNKIFVFDLEASCWEPRDSQPSNEFSEIIEIGFSIVDLKSLSIEVTDTILIKPVRSRISQFCTELTTLTEEKLNNDGVSFPEACNTLRAKYKTHQITSASFGEYDRTMMQSSCQFFGCDYPLSTKHLNIKNACAILEGLTKEQGQSQILERFKIKEEGTKHRGIDDAKNLAKILIKMIEKYRNA